MESRTQGSRPRPRPRTQKKSEAKAKAKDSLSEDRHSRGQGQECSRPRPRAKDTKRKCSPKKKKKGLHKNFSGDLQKKKKKKKKKRSSQKFFKRSPRKNAFQIHVLEPCPRAEDRPIFEDLRPRGQGQGLDLRGQGQELQNLSSRTSSRPRTSSRTPPLILSLKKAITPKYINEQKKKFVHNK